MNYADVKAGMLFVEVPDIKHPRPRTVRVDRLQKYTADVFVLEGRDKNKTLRLPLKKLTSRGCWTPPVPL